MTGKVFSSNPTTHSDSTHQELSNELSHVPNRQVLVKRCMFGLENFLRELSRMGDTLAPASVALDDHNSASLIYNSSHL